MVPNDVPAGGDESGGRFLMRPRTWITILILAILGTSAYALSTTGLYGELKGALSSTFGGLSQGLEGDLPLITAVLLLSLLAIARERFLVIPLMASWVMLAPAILSFSGIDWSQTVLPGGSAEFLTSTLPSWTIVLMGFALVLISLMYRSYVQLSRVRTILRARRAPALQVDRATSSMFIMMGLLSLLAAGVAALVGGLAFLVSPEIASLGLDARMLAITLVLISLATYGALLLFERYGGGGSKKPRERRY